MGLNEQNVPAKDILTQDKAITLTAGQVFTVEVDGTADTDFSYTVPVGKTVEMRISVVGTQTDAE